MPQGELPPLAVPNAWLSGSACTMPDIQSAFNMQAPLGVLMAVMGSKGALLVCKASVRSSLDHRQ